MDKNQAITLQLKADLKNARRTPFLKLFLDLHPHVQGQFYLQSNLTERATIVEWLDLVELAHMFNDINYTKANAAELLAQLGKNQAVQLLEHMYSDNASQLLSLLDEEQRQTYMDLLSNPQAVKVYPAGTAGALMNNNYVAVTATMTVKKALATIKTAAQRIESFQYIYVTDQADALVGVLSFRALILNDAQTLVKDVMNHHLITTNPAEDQEVVARLMADYNFVALPVIEAGKLVGMITIDDIVHVLDTEASEDYSALAGTDVNAPQQNPLLAALKRLPWLIGLIFLGLGTSTIIDGYDSLIARASVLAVFVSLITGTGGNAGTQSLAIAIRRLSLGERPNIIRAFITELIIGITVGVVAGATIFIVIWVWKGDMLLGLAVGLAMGIAILVANIAGAFIPRIMDRFGVDPAVASGPFITTLSDLTSVMIYFSIAGLFISHFMN
ncbi:magnesium-transporting ATPase [Weissella oryzae SG25]|uniref:Magnesium transporter MgtE n=1 Tax=Weissella oryzae (strain DSM 25784 / JCM 18191 / LMG 30913 / SG25) TaxID=1329250 RepID=A0A069CUV6_WEIOS|nr:magnesium transporter [Weissella oryzae]GAK31254.1 magnesium-transporting ATPase [Weissella oryzae SG25]